MNYINLRLLDSMTSSASATLNRERIYISGFVCDRGISDPTLKKCPVFPALYVTGEHGTFYSKKGPMFPWFIWGIAGNIEPFFHKRVLCSTVT